jgi:hypothetical protein
MSFSRAVSLRLALVVFVIAAGSARLAAEKKPQPPPPAHATSPVPAVTDEYVHKEFGDNCSVLGGPPQFVGDLDGDGVDDLVIAARCKNPMADQAEYGFQRDRSLRQLSRLSATSKSHLPSPRTPERKGVCLLIVHGVGPEAWRSDKPKPKFLLINLPFKTLTVKRLALKKRPSWAFTWKSKVKAKATSSVIFWDGKKYRYQVLGC